MDQQTNGTAPMLQLVNGKDNLQETPNDAIPKKSHQMDTTTGGPNMNIDRAKPNS